MTSSSLPGSAGIPKRDLLGVPFALVDYTEAMDAMDGMIARREPGYVAAAAVHVLMVSRHDPETRAALRGASLVVPDGRPLVWALNLLGARLDDRVYGPELTARYCRRAAQRGHRVWLYGGATPAALAGLRSALTERFPGLSIAGGHAPPHRPLSEDEERALAEQINADAPDVVWVGIGAPRQEQWMARMRPFLEAPVLAGVGAAFDFISGRKRQAPPWMQRRGLEWLFRLSQDPLRLAPRYLRYNPAFVAAFARQYIRERRGLGPGL
jgi:N-acetylglucosaminyldiphosphoundecaprenol N-acetyl-beta-D-mannosaminyltransferase